MLFFGRPPTSDSPALDAVPVTVSDTTADPGGPFRGLYVGAAGAVKITTAGGDRVIPGILAGTTLRIACTRVWSTGTTVAAPGTNILGLV